MILSTLTRSFIDTQNSVLYYKTNEWTVITLSLNTAEDIGILSVTVALSLHLNNIKECAYTLTNKWQA